jgi:hypothetical protein
VAITRCASTLEARLGVESDTPHTGPLRADEVFGRHPAATSEDLDDFEGTAGLLVAQSVADGGELGFALPYPVEDLDPATQFGAGHPACGQIYVDVARGERALAGQHLVHDRPRQAIAHAAAEKDLEIKAHETLLGDHGHDWRTSQAARNHRIPPLRPVGVDRGHTVRSGLSDASSCCCG